MSDYPPTVPPATPPPPGGGSYTPPPPPPGGGYTPPPSGGGGYTPPPAGGSSDRTLWLILSYFGIFALIPFFGKKDDAEVQWHAKNGTALFLAEIVVWIAMIVLGFVARGVMLGCGMSAVWCIISIGIIVMSVWCMIQAVNGKRPRLPVITDFAEKL